MDHEQIIDEERFATLLDTPKSAPKEPTPKAPQAETTFVETNLSWKGRPAGIVWCYPARGLPRKYTGNLHLINLQIEERGVPCLAFVLTIRPTKMTRWTFYNAPQLAVRSFAGKDFVRPRCRLGTNDKFMIEHIVGSKVVRERHYRRLPKAFPKDFLYAVGAAQETTT